MSKQLFVYRCAECGARMVHVEDKGATTQCAWCEKPAPKWVDGPLQDHGPIFHAATKVPVVGMVTQPGGSQRGIAWRAFAEDVLFHIENYTVPQYGDTGNDQVSQYDTQACVRQAMKYMERFGRNMRPGEQFRDFLKAAHYIQLAAEKFSEQKATEDESAEFSAARSVLDVMAANGYRRLEAVIDGKLVTVGVERLF